MEDIAKKINESIKQSYIYKRYVLCKKNIDSNKELQLLKDKMKKIKDSNCRHNDKSLIEDYYLLEKEYMNNILVKEYEDSKAELYILLSDISDILSFK